MFKLISFEDFNTNMNEWIYFVELSIGILSMIGSSFIILAFIFYQKLRNKAFELVFYMTIASFFNNLSYLIYYIEADNKIVEDMTLCRAQAFLMIWSEVSQMTWAFLISYSVYDSVVNFDYMSADDHYSTCIQRIKYLTIGFVWPLVVSIIGLACDYLGPSGKWCWINSITNNPFAIAYGWFIYVCLWSSIISGCVITFLVIRFLSRAYSGQKYVIVSRFVTKLITYPLIQIVCWLPATLNRLVFDFSGCYNLYLQLLALLFVSSQGLAYAIAYGFNPQVRSALYGTFCKNRKENVSSAIDYRTSNGSFISIESHDRRDERFQGRLVDFSL
jgi:hypothetical protein